MRLGRIGLDDPVPRPTSRYEVIGKRERPMLQIEFVGVSQEGAPAEVIDRMRTDLTDVKKAVVHAKSLFSNVIVQRSHKPLPHGFRILDEQGAEVARWSIDES